jgi:hypothetical protein
MVHEHGVVYCVTKWAGFGNQTTEGFDDFIAAGMADMTAEALVLKFSNRFPPAIVSQARERLSKVGGLTS